MVNVYKMFKNVALVVSTALAVRYLPKLLHKKLPVHVGGYCKQGFEDVKTVFRDNFERGPEPRHSGSAFAVYHRGEKVVDVYGGYADANIPQQWKENTLSLVYSTTKAVAAVCIAVLVDRGLLDYKKPVAHYWPEFGTNGKEEITVEQLLEHKAGLPLFPEPISYDLLRDCAKCGSVLASAPPQWTPGTDHGYHAVTYGPLTNELLRRVDPAGRTMGRFFAEEIARPFGIDFYIGLPLGENYRAAKLSSSHIDGGLASMFHGFKSSRNLAAMRGGLTDRSFIKELIQNAGDIINIKTQDDPEIRAIEIPSMNGYGTAESLAKLMGILSCGGTDLATKKTLLSEDLVSSFFIPEPPTIDKIMKLPISFKYGFVVDYADDGGVILGHPGAGGQVAFADPARQLGYAFTSRHAAPFGFGDDPRFKRLQRSMYQCLQRM